MERFILPWRFAIFFLLCWELELCAAVNEEGRSLLMFKEKLVDPFGVLADWNGEEAPDPCSWFGVGCADGRVVSLKLKNMWLQGTLAPELGKLIHMKYLNLNNNSFSGIIPHEIGGMQNLEVLDLGNNNLSGLPPPELGSILSLEILVLEGNCFIASVPLDLNKLVIISEMQTDSKMSCSKKLVKRNAKNGVIRRLLQLDGKVKSQHHSNYRTGQRSSSLAPFPSLSPLFSPSHPPSGAAILPPIFFPPSPSNDVPASQPSPSPSDFMAPAPSPSSTSEAPSLIPISNPNPTILPPSPYPPLPSPIISPSSVGRSNHGNHTIYRTIYISIIGGVSFLIVLTILFVFCCRANKVVSVRPWSTGLSGQLQKAFVTGVPALKRSEIEIACEDFSNIIGSLPDCKFYKGTLSSGVEIAVVSTLIISSKDWSKQCESQFRKKISTLSKVNHKNFVNLLGYCEEEEPFTRMMVFEYAPNGTLFEHLHVKEAEHLGWAARLRIAMGIAYFLDHMHQLNPPVIIKNLDSSSIYLTEDYAAKVSDIRFWVESEETKSPPPHFSGTLEVPILEQKNSVYSFGLLLIEIVSGRIPASGDVLLESWASCYLNGERPVKEMMDPTLTLFREADVIALCEVIRSCINPDLQERPTMSKIVSRLKDITLMTPDRATPMASPLWWAELEILTSEAN